MWYISNELNNFGGFVYRTLALKDTLVLSDLDGKLPNIRATGLELLDRPDLYENTFGLNAVQDSTSGRIRGFLCFISNRMTYELWKRVFCRHNKVLIPRADISDMDWRLASASNYYNMTIIDYNKNCPYLILKPRVGRNAKFCFLPSYVFFWTIYQGLSASVPFVSFNVAMDAQKTMVTHKEAVLHYYTFKDNNEIATLVSKFYMLVTDKDREYMRMLEDTFGDILIIYFLARELFEWGNISSTITGSTEPSGRGVGKSYHD